MMKLICDVCGYVIDTIYGNERDCSECDNNCFVRLCSKCEVKE